MPNLISVTQSGPNILEPIQEAVAPIALHPETRKTIGGIRKAGAILQGNPVGAFAAELIFPDSVADGTLDGAVKKGAIGRYERGY